MSFDKIQIRVSVNDSDHLKNISLLNVEVGYPNSTNQTVWKSNARIFTEEKILDTMKQATWKTFDDNAETFVFDFYNDHIFDDVSTNFNFWNIWRIFYSIL